MKHVVVKHTEPKLYAYNHVRCTSNQQYLMQKCTLIDCASNMVLRIQLINTNACKAKQHDGK